MMWICCWGGHREITSVRNETKSWLVCRPIGTKRMLGVTAGPVADDADDPIVPKNLAFDSSKEVFGDFEVCPFTHERKGEMQMVCVQSVKNLSIK